MTKRWSMCDVCGCERWLSGSRSWVRSDRREVQRMEFWPLGYFLGDHALRDAFKSCNGHRIQDIAQACRIDVQTARDICRIFGISRHPGRYRARRDARALDRLGAAWDSLARHA